jgi:hypothetical protein
MVKPEEFGDTKLPVQGCGKRGCRSGKTNSKAYLFGVGFLSVIENIYVSCYIKDRDD